MLGLRNGTNALVDYDPRWPAEFERERQRLAAALDGVVLGIEHYGSTAVPGMRAKPILDILLGVLPLENRQHCHDPLLELGYDYAETPAWPDTISSAEGATRRSGRIWCTWSSISARPGAATWRFAIGCELTLSCGEPTSLKRSGPQRQLRPVAPNTTS